MSTRLVALVRKDAGSVTLTLRLRASQRGERRDTPSRKRPAAPRFPPRTNLTAFLCPEYPTAEKT
jgi:hypothetical protein